MKKKLNVVFILIGIALFGIIIFQIYWTFNAYKANKEKFDSTINTAMQSAMDDCKKDYFDSIRRVLVKRLSPPETTITIDTMHEADIVNVQLFFHFSSKSMPGMEPPFSTTKPMLDFYRKKINKPNPSIPEILTEMSFYAPGLMSNFTLLLGMDDIVSHREQMPVYGKIKPGAKKQNNPGTSFKIVHWKPETSNDPKKKRRDALLASLKDGVTPGEQSRGFFKKHMDSIVEAHIKRIKMDYLADSAEVLKRRQNHAPGQVKSTPPASPPSHSKLSDAVEGAMMRRFTSAIPNSIYAFPPNYRKADSARLYHYLKKELHITGINSPFSLAISTQTGAPAKQNLHYSETSEINYKYHGFKIFGIVGPELFIKAQFHNPQYGVLRSMIITLLLSVLLILFVIFCFNYIVQTFIEQKKLSDLKDDFINNMTHELKTPIATITVAIEGLQSFNALNDPEKTKRYLQTSRNELARLNNLVTKVLDIASFENKKIDLVKEPLNIKDLIAEIIETEKSKSAKTVNISFIDKLDVGFIYADKLHFRNVMVNLVDNASKYSKDPVGIVITAAKAGVDALFSVKDNGNGIPAAHISQVFDKFHRVPTGNVHTVKGTGLGLSYVKYIVEAHGGSITVKSELHKGSEFIIIIPLNNG